MFKRMGWAAGIVGVGLLTSPLVMAQDPIHKIGRGVTNVLTSWIEMPKHIHLGSQQPNPVTGMGMGLLKGITLAILRGGIGAYETVTFLLPYPKGFGSPYEPMALPDFVWE